MRDYSHNNRNAVRAYLHDAYDATCHDYRDPYYYQSVPDNYSFLKEYGLSVGLDASHHIRPIRTSIDNALTIINKFYSSIDTTSSDIGMMANSIIDILNEVNSSMEKINSAITGVGKYEGKKVSPSDIRAAGIDESKCAKLKNKFYDSFMKDNDTVAMCIKEMEEIKEKNGSLTSTDMAKLYKFYDWYVDNRFDGKEDENIKNMDEQTLKNCVNTYELINPNAKNITGEFFKMDIHTNDSYRINREAVDLNILKIKYGIYTCDPVYRDIILGYLPRVTLNMLLAGELASFSNNKEEKDKKPTLNMDLYTTNKAEFCGFFHEIGHAVDYLSWSEGDASETLQQSLKEDAASCIRSNLNVYNTLPDSDKISSDEITSIVNYVFNLDENPNIVENPGDEPSLPKDWSDSMIRAYKYLGELYGYPEYQYSNFDRTRIYPKQGWYKNANRDSIVDDALGGMTNSKLCGFGHGYSLKDKKSSDYINFEDFRVKIISDSYYHSGNQFDTEFFAEVFKYQALKRDMTTTEKVFFPSVCKFNVLIQKAYEQVK